MPLVASGGGRPFPPEDVDGAAALLALLLTLLDNDNALGELLAAVTPIS